MIETKINIPFKDKATLALWKINDPTVQKGKDIFLTHGTFSNRKICMGISEYLVKIGYTCWILEWRNHGESTKLNEPYNFEIVGKEDLTAAFNYLFNIEKLEKVDCITHSGGGISLVINLIEYPQNIKRINRIVFFGCQSFGAGYNFGNRLKIWSGKYSSKVLGYIPARPFGRPHDEEYSFMKQWFDWNLSGRFLGENSVDYELEMEKIKIPILSIAGAGDHFIAPVSGCQLFLAGFKNSNNKFLVCGKANGFMEDYSHSRLIYSRSAAQEIYPEVLEWLA